MSNDTSQLRLEVTYCTSALKITGSAHIRGPIAIKDAPTWVVEAFESDSKLVRIASEYEGQAAIYQRLTDE